MCKRFNCCRLKAAGAFLHAGCAFHREAPDWGCAVFALSEDSIDENNDINATVGVFTTEEGATDNGPYTYSFLVRGGPSHRIAIGSRCP